MVGKIASAVGSTLIPDELFATIIEELRAHVGFHRCAIGRRDRASGVHAHWWTWDDAPVEKLITEVSGP